MADTNTTVPTKRKRSRFTDTTAEEVGRTSTTIIVPSHSPDILLPSSSTTTTVDKGSLHNNHDNDHNNPNTTETVSDSKRIHTDLSSTLPTTAVSLNPSPSMTITTTRSKQTTIVENEIIHRDAIGMWDTTDVLYDDATATHSAKNTDHVPSPTPPPPSFPPTDLPIRQLTSYGDLSTDNPTTIPSSSNSSSSSSSSSTNPSSSLPSSVSSLSVQDDIIRKRKERLEQWKLKQQSQISSNPDITPPQPQSFPATVPSLLSSSSSTIPPNSSVVTNNHQHPAKGGVKLSLKPTTKLTIHPTQKNSTFHITPPTTTPIPTTFSSLPSRPSPPKRLYDDEDEVEDRTMKPLSSQLPLESMDDGEKEKETEPPSYNNEAQNNEDDELDQYMKGLGNIVPGASEALASVRSGVITLDDLQSSSSSSTDDNEMELVSTTASTNTGSKPTKNEKDEMEEDERYHQLFIQSLRSTSSSLNSTTAPPVVPNSAETTLSSAADPRLPPSTLNVSSSSSTSLPSQPQSQAQQPQLEDDITLDEEIALFDSEEWKEERSALDILKEKMAKKDIKPVDHASVAYIPFRKDFYIEAKEISNLSEDAVASLREDLEIVVRGKNVPRPLTTWEHTGLPDKLVNVLLQRNFTAPFAIQRQALPIIMSGRDIIGVARTGSGKTLAYLLPLFRQILDQPPLREGDGPIALVMAPARELVVQIYHEARKLAKALDIRVTAIYGGAPIAEQIRSLKRGSELVVCTPGRMIDILTLNAGRMLNFHRVTYTVLDEADRMFDMGFEPQISRILSLIRPDRQTVMFSATFPVHVEGLARKVLHNPIEVVVGGRSKASPHIQQYVEIFDDTPYFPGMTDASNGGNKKYRRLLQLLGDWYEQGSVIIFVDTKEHCDSLFADLLKAGYPALSLHGGKDQNDRDQTIADFKSGIRTIMIATSVAGRGLDVKNLVLVINYACPNHLEDYVHRVGRTGRAGNQGTAYTFITPSEAPYAYDLIRALKDAKQSDHIPPELVKMADDHKRKVDAGEARKRSSGYSSAKGYKFDGSELSGTEAIKKAQKLAYEVEAGITTVEDYLAEEAEKREVQEMSERLEAEIQEDKVTEINLREGKVHVKVTNLLDEDETGENTHNGGSGSSTMNVTSTTSTTTVPTISHLPTTTTGTPLPSVDPTSIEQLRAKALFAKQAVSIGLVTPEEAKLAEQALAEAEKMYAASIAEAAALTAAKVAAAKAAALAFTKSSGTTVGTGNESNGATIVTPEELEINDYPQQARWKLIKEGIKRIEEWTGATLTSKGTFIQPGRPIPSGERKLYLLIEGPNDVIIRKAKTEARRILEEETLRVGLHSTGSQYGKFQI